MRNPHDIAPLRIDWTFKKSLKADLHDTTLSHAICLRQVYSVGLELFRVNQTYNMLAIVVYDTKNIVSF